MAGAPSVRQSQSDRQRRGSGESDHEEELTSNLTANDGIKRVTLYLGAVSAVPGMVTEPEDDVLSVNCGAFQLAAGGP
jgi:hypothetical protein